MSITGIIIAKNEEKIIHNAIESLKFCDEILVINNQSTDKTQQVSEKLGAKVIDFKSNNFSKIRNFGKEKANSDYLLYIDADEVVSDGLRKQIVAEIKSKPKFSAYSIERKNFYLGENEWPVTENMIRLFLKDKMVGWKGSIHESPVYDGEVGSLEGYILHFTHRNLSQMLKKTLEWSEIEAKLRLDANHPKMTFFRFMKVMTSTFLSYFIKQRGYRLGTVGLIESLYQSFSTFITYSKLWEMQKNSNRS